VAGEDKRIVGDGAQPISESSPAFGRALGRALGLGIQRDGRAWDVQGWPSSRIQDRLCRLYESTVL
jgi:hypothetical protein